MSCKHAHAKTKTCSCHVTALMSYTCPASNRANKEMSLSLMQDPPRPPEGCARTASVKMHSITFLPRGSGGLQECRPGVSSPHPCSSHPAAEMHFRALIGCSQCLFVAILGGQGKGTRRNGKGEQEGTGKQGREREGNRKGTKRRKEKKEKEKRKGTPQNLAPRGIFVGTLTPNKCPKMHLRGGVAAAGMRAGDPGAAFLQTPATSRQKCNGMHLHRGCPCTAFRGAGGVLHKREVQKLGGGQK